MVFKQKILKYEFIKFGITAACTAIPYIVIAIISFLYQYEMKFVMAMLFIFFTPVFLLILLIDLKNLEWYCIYEDHIDVKTIYGIKNSVYYNQVFFVEELKINLTTRGMEKTFYIFNDGRRNSSNMLGINSCYNKKKYNLRIYKTNILENYIKNTLKLKVNVENNE